MKIGDRIKRVRGTLSRKAFGDMLNVSLNTITRYETGERSPDSDFIELLCKSFNISPSWLIFGGDNNCVAAEMAEESIEQPDKEKDDQKYKKIEELKEELLNAYREITLLRAQTKQLKNRKEVYQAQLITIGEEINTLIEFNRDAIEGGDDMIQVAVATEEGEKKRALIDVLNDLVAMTDDIYVGRGSRRVMGYTTENPLAARHIPQTGANSFIDKSEPSEQAPMNQHEIRARIGTENFLKQLKKFEEQAAQDLAELRTDDDEDGDLEDVPVLGDFRYIKADITNKT